MVAATTWARVVLPVPAGPHRMAEVRRSCSMRTRSGASGATRWRWPTMSSRVRGRRRAASGARWRSRSAAAWAKRSGAPGPGRRGARLAIGVPPPGRPGRAQSPAGRDAQAQVAQRPLGQRLGRAGHGVGPGLGLRIGDDLAEVVLARQDGHEPVDADGEPAVRGGAVAERAQQEPEAGLGLLGADAQGGEDAALDVLAVDTDRPRAELRAVEHEVIGLGAHPGGVASRAGRGRRDGAS